MCIRDSSRIGRIEKVDFRSTTLFDGMCLDTFLIVSRIEFVVFVLFLCSIWGRLIRRSRAGESRLKTASWPARGFRGSALSCLLCSSCAQAALNHTSSSRLFREQSVRLSQGGGSCTSSSRLRRWISSSHQREQSSSSSSSSSGVAKRSSITRTAAIG